MKRELALIAWNLFTALDLSLATGVARYLFLRRNVHLVLSNVVPIQAFRVTTWTERLSSLPQLRTFLIG